MIAKTSWTSSSEMGATVAPTWGALMHEPLGLQELQRLADGDGAHLELAADLVDDQALAGGELAPHDGAAQGLVDVLLLRPEPHVGAAPEGHGASSRP